MELLLNELSLAGQFTSTDEFIITALPSMISVLKEIDGTRDFLFKKYDFYSSLVTCDYSLHDIVFGSISREYDEIRRFKTRLAVLFEDPYWEENPKHSSEVSYLFNGCEISGSSLAEACERDRIVISFLFIGFNKDKIEIEQGFNTIPLDNLFDKGHFLDVLKKRQIISFEQFCRTKFQGCKLDFSKIDSRQGFNLITEETEDLFYDSFRKFEALTWPQIQVDDALDYKEFNSKKYFKAIDFKIMKFRISKKIRCFGYVSSGVFYILMFDLTHKLSD